MMQKAFLTSGLLFASLLLAEPSAFDAPATNQTTTQNSSQNAQKQNQQQNNLNGETVSDLKSSIEGLQSLVVGQGEQLNDLKQQFNSNITSDQPTSLKELNKRFEENLKLQNENFEKINNALTQLATIIDTISETYVSKEQLKLNLGKGYKDYKNTLKKPQVDNNATADSQKQQPQKNNDTALAADKTANTQTKEQSSKDLDATYEAAIKDFKANNDAAAKQKFDDLLKAKYGKKAAVEYYVGEIYYKNGDYKNAIESYQKSVQADDKSPFLPLILYHTAYSLEKLNDKQGAKKILQNLITNYPDNYLIPAAKKKLAELK